MQSWASPRGPYARARGAPQCRYGANCTRKNPDHFAEYDHPDAIIRRLCQPSAQHPPSPVGDDDDTDTEEYEPAPVRGLSATQLSPLAAGAPAAGSAAGAAAAGSATDDEPASPGSPDPMHADPMHAALADQIAQARPFKLCLVVGESASGKSRLLGELARRGVVSSARRAPQQWPAARAIVSHLCEKLGGVQPAIDRLSAVGLNTVPAWTRPFSSLSNGMQERAALALALAPRLALDDFGDVVDTRVRRLLASGLARLVRKMPDLHTVIVATVDASLCPWLQPDVLVQLGATPRLTRNPAAAPERPAVRIRYVASQYDGEQPEGDVDEAAAAVDALGVRRRSRVVSAQRTSGDASTASGQAREATSSVKLDAAAVEACRIFGLDASDVDTTRLTSYELVVPDELLLNRTNWRVACLVGGSGSGKSLTLGALARRSVAPARLGGARSVASLVQEASRGHLPSREAAATAMACIGLSSAASGRPYASLSSGEQHLADVAYACAASSADPSHRVVAIDEFTSALDRAAAGRACVGMRALLDACAGDGRPPKPLAVATVHVDVLAHLQPDLCFHAGSRQCHLLDAWPAASASTASASSAASASPAGSAASASPFERPTLDFELRTCPDFPKVGGHATGLWECHFKQHHYLDSSLHRGAHCDVLRVAGTHELVGFGATISHFGTMCEEGMDRAESLELGRKLMREHRVVVLPQFQGLAVGPVLSDTIASTWCATLDDNYNSTRYYSKTTHPRFGRYREANPAWRAVPSGNKPAQSEFVHEYVGARYGFGAAEERKAPVTGGYAKPAAKRARV